MGPPPIRSWKESGRTLPPPLKNPSGIPVQPPTRPSLSHRPEEPVTAGGGGGLAGNDAQRGLVRGGAGEAGGAARHMHTRLIASKITPITRNKKNQENVVGGSRLRSHQPHTHWRESVSPPKDCKCSGCGALVHSCLDLLWFPYLDVTTEHFNSTRHFCECILFLSLRNMPLTHAQRPIPPALGVHGRQQGQWRHQLLLAPARRSRVPERPTPAPNRGRSPTKGWGEDVNFLTGVARLEARPSIVVGGGQGMAITHPNI